MREMELVNLISRLCLLETDREIKYCIELLDELKNKMKEKLKDDSSDSSDSE